MLDAERYFILKDKINSLVFFSEAKNKHLATEKKKNEKKKNQIKFI